MEHWSHWDPLCPPHWHCQNEGAGEKKRKKDKKMEQEKKKEKVMSAEEESAVFDT